MFDIGLASDPSNAVTVKVAGRQIGGWDQVQITAALETVPRTFSVGMTALQGPVAQPGDSCEVYIGSDKVVTGYIDRVGESGSEASHQLSLVGRGKCCDLVDCSAEWTGGQITGSNALQVASKLAQPYGINVYAAPGTDLGPTIPQFNLSFGETAYAIIERITRYGGQLAYEDASGALVLAQVGTAVAASGVAYGQNVQAWSVTSSQDGRYSDYTVALVAIDTFGELGPLSTYYTAYDKNVKRHRLQYLVVEAVANGPDLTVRRAKWEAARLAGRGTVVTSTVDSWRDSAGSLWAPNTRAPVDVPGLTLANNNLVISEAVYRYGDDGGTLADLTLMPAEAFALEPVVLQPTPLAAAIQNNV